MLHRYSLHCNFRPAHTYTATSRCTTSTTAALKSINGVGWNRLDPAQGHNVPEAPGIRTFTPALADSWPSGGGLKAKERGTSPLKRFHVGERSRKQRRGAGRGGLNTNGV